MSARKSPGPVRRHFAPSRAGRGPAWLIALSWLVICLVVIAAAGWSIQLFVAAFGR